MSEFRIQPSVTFVILVRTSKEKAVFELFLEGLLVYCCVNLRVDPARACRPDAGQGKRH